MHTYTHVFTDRDKHIVIHSWQQFLLGEISNEYRLPDLDGFQNGRPPVTPFPEWNFCLETLCRAEFRGRTQCPENAENAIAPLHRLRTTDKHIIISRFCSNSVTVTRVLWDAVHPFKYVITQRYWTVGRLCQKIYVYLNAQEAY